MASKDKAHYQAVKEVEKDLENKLIEIHNLLKNKTYKVSSYTIKKIKDNGKERILMKLPYYPDRIVQWAIMLQLENIFYKNFCKHTCASIKNRGTTKASELLRRYLRDEENTQYCLKIDVKKFYPNINHEILKKLLRKKFKDKDLLWLLDLYIDSAEGEIGVPIGSYLSQFLGNFYLSYFDHWLKEDKHIKYVIRYMDDVVILHKDKTYLHSLFLEIKNYLKKELKLEVKGNWQIFPSRIRGIDFVGFRDFGDYNLLRKRIAKNLKSKMIKYKKQVDSGEELYPWQYCSILSYCGLALHCDSTRLRRKYIKPLETSVNIYYQKNICNKKKKGKENNGNKRKSTNG